MATTPTYATRIRFLNGVPFYPDYKDVRRFTSVTEQAYWFNQKTPVYEMSQSYFQRSEKGTYISVSSSIDTLYNVNYVHFINPDFNNKNFYAFVTNLVYSSKSVTHVYIDIDVWQTWYFDISIKPSHIEREHMNPRVSGQPVINTQTEGLNYGSEYDLVDVTTIEPSKYLYMVIQASKQIAYINADVTTKIPFKGGATGTPSPLFTYILPILKTTMETPQSINGNPCMRLQGFMDIIAKDTDVVNAVQSIHLTEWCGLSLAETDASVSLSPLSVEAGFATAFLKRGDGEQVYPIYYIKETLHRIIKRRLLYNGKWEGLDTGVETKLLMYPYTIIELDDMKGNRLTLKPEYINGDSIDIVLRGSIGYSNKISYEVENYNNNSGTEATFQNSIIDSSPNDVPIITDYLAAFIQGNRNSLQTKQDISNIDGVMTGAVGAMSGIMGMAGGIATGNPAAVVGGLTGALTGITQGATHSLKTAMQISAQTMDAQNVPPSVQKMGGNTSFDFGNGFTGIRIIRKQIKPEYKRTLSDFFNKFGLKVNVVKKPNLATRKYWNFVKTNGVTLQGNLNAIDLLRLRQIFDDGVTIWHIDDIGNYDLVNEMR